MRKTTKEIIGEMDDIDRRNALLGISDALGEERTGELLQGYFEREVTPEAVRAEVRSWLDRHPSEYEDLYIDDAENFLYEEDGTDIWTSMAMWAIDKAVREQVPRLEAMQDLGMDAEMEAVAEAIIDLLLNGETEIANCAGEYAAAAAGYLRTGLENGDIGYCFKIDEDDWEDDNPDGSERDGRRPTWRRARPRCRSGRLRGRRLASGRIGTASNRR